MPYAYTFKAKSQRAGRVSFMRGSQELWVETNSLARIDFTVRNFASQAAQFLPSDITGKDFTFIYKNGVYSLNAETLDAKSLTKISDTPPASSAYFSDDKGLILLAGASARGLNAAFLLPAQKKFIPLTLLAGDAALISADFSPNHEYVALHISLGDSQSVLIYRVDTGALVSTTGDVQTFRWSPSSEAVVAKAQSVILVKPEGVETLLYSAPKNKKEIQVIIAQPADEFLLDIDGLVYRLDGDGIVKTAYASIERSRSGSLQRVEKKDNTVFTHKNKILRPLSGKPPLWDFVSFAGDETLVYSRKSATGAISTLYFYDAAKDESKPYRWVEEPAQVLESGLAYETVEDKGETWIFFEYPGGKASMLRLNELLK